MKRKLILGLILIALSNASALAQDVEINGERCLRREIEEVAVRGALDDGVFVTTFSESGINLRPSDEILSLLLTLRGRRGDNEFTHRTPSSEERCQVHLDELSASSGKRDAQVDVWCQSLALENQIATVVIKFQRCN